MTTKKELEDLAAAALLDERRNNYVSQTVAQMYKNAITVIDVVVPKVTEAIAEHFLAEAERLDERVGKSGYAMGVEVERERDHALRTARFIQNWRPTDEA